MIAQELAEAQITTNAASSVPNWWDVHIHGSAWSHPSNPWQAQNPNSASSCDDDIAISATSFTNASDHSALSADSNATELPGEHAEHHLWRQVLLGENFMEVISSKNQIPDPAFNYLKKLDNNSWGALANPNPLNYFSKLPVAINGRFAEGERLSNWSIAPPASTTNSLNSFMGRYVEPNFSSGKQATQTSSSETAHLRSICGISSMNQLGFSEPSFGAVNPESPWSSIKNFSFGKPLIDFRGQKSSAKSSDSVDSRNQTAQSTSVSSEGKKKRTEDNAESRLKKQKSESSVAASNKQPQVPKVKLAERITALQQIVSPFGKTDTASVLLETINFITYLHEQVQLLSDPYMKSGFPKDHSSWGGTERKEKEEVDLKSRGLCLVPVSSTPPVYRENNGPDFWTPTYRGCLYR